MKIFSLLTNNFKIIPRFSSVILNNHCKKFNSNQSLKVCNTMGIPLKDLIKKLEVIAPLDTAESWDNVGLLVQPESYRNVKSVLLTIDLTEQIVDEALKLGAELIISYHPNIFRPLKTVTQSTWKERIITKCIKNDIAIYSPHTTWDAMQDGVNDWLGSCLPVGQSKPILASQANPKIGMGRVLTLETPITIQQAIDLIKSHIRILHLRLGLGKSKSLDSPIATVALCAGSGASVLSGVEADLYLTGEMLHHDVLDATQKGISVILCNHSDSERGFLKTFQRVLANEQVTIHVSVLDKDCLRTV